MDLLQLIHAFNAAVADVAEKHAALEAANEQQQAAAAAHNAAVAIAESAKADLYQQVEGVFPSSRVRVS